MRDRRYLESKPNWQATFRRRRKARQRFLCLMRTVTGGYYWDTPQYKGLFWWAATKEYRQKDLQHVLDNGLLVLVKGELPKGIRKAGRYQ
jgi:hypothetical protein